MDTQTHKTKNDAHSALRCEGRVAALRIQVTTGHETFLAPAWVSTHAARDTTLERESASAILSASVPNLLSAGHKYAWLQILELEYSKYYVP